MRHCFIGFFYVRNFALPTSKGKGQALDRRPVSLPCCAEGPSCETEFIPGKNLVMTTKITITASPLKLDVEQGFHPNTDLCVDVKTLLRSDRRTRMSKNYMGVLTRDAEDHYTFIESQPSTNGKRNPHVFVGRFITITRQDDGTLRPNFKPIKKGAGWSVESYARSVYDELREALNGLVEEV